MATGKLENVLTFANQSVKPIFLENILPDPEQPRKTFDQSSIEELANSIKQHGLLQPIVVRRHPENEIKFIIVVGDRRFRAFQYLVNNAIEEEKSKWAKIEARVIDYKGDLDLKAKQYIENVVREDLNPIERAEGIQNLFNLLRTEDPSTTWGKVEEYIGISTTTRKRLLDLLKAPPEIKGLIKIEELTPFDYEKFKKLSPAGKSDFKKRLREGKKVKFNSRENKKNKFKNLKDKGLEGEFVEDLKKVFEKYLTQLTGEDVKLAALMVIRSEKGKTQKVAKKK
jgi:ParB family transcriptional regulator, chromosome partitioning protein